MLLVGLVALLGACDDTPSDSAPRRINATVTLGGLGDTPGRFGYPRCIDHDDEALWVIDKTARVQRIDPATGRALALWRMPEWDLGKPTGFCVAPGPDEQGRWCDHLLYVADTHYHRVMIYRPPAAGRDPATGAFPEPTLVASFGSYGNGPGQFYYPTDVAVLLGADGKSVERIYVSEYGGNDRVSAFDPKFNFLFSFGREGMGKDPAAIEFNRPQSIVIRPKSDGSKELVVTDAANHRLGRFTLDGKLIAWIGTAGEFGRKPGQFYYPYGLALLPDSTALVTEFGGARVQRIDLDTGRSLGVWGEPGREAGQIQAPWAVTVFKGQAFVLDSANNRVMGFALPR
jgi:hypothetical protein